ncbi:MAG: 50S ribosomal protein L18 [Bacillota bacterium]|uniref:Large ribosomal subunit protein uL18 n=1 Tax=Thermanaerosceptrum fracticalcis TaxID=1712410 RepID=A0A7G6E5V5_THEFR|nr:50S ribosomal protein L18 [Thermanaerosceptrum fracticalcis]QNB47459.1 50S ribosomal protein L18 [Thermanaerosceptrum fracticalcis]
MITKPDRKKVRQKKHLRIRKRIQGTLERPRLAVYRSLKHMYAQLIDDVKGVTLVSASTLETGIKEQIENGGNMDAAKKVGELLAKKAIEKGITNVVFDRGGNLYHGRVKAVAEGAREGGLQF